MKFRSLGVGAIVLTVAGALALGGCAPKGGGSTSGGGTGIVTGNGNEPQNPLIPTNTTEVGGGKILDSIFAGLVYYDENGAPLNDLAESIESTDAINYTIKVRKGATFTNGEPVNAKSFVDAWNFGALLSNAQSNSYFFEDIQGFSYDQDSPLTGLKIVDDHTFTVALKEARSDFPLRLGYSGFFPLPRVAYQDIAAFGEAPVGNGPYKLANENAWKHNEKIDLVPNPDYSGPRKVKNGGLTIVFYATQSAAYADLLSGQLDVLDAVPPAEQSTFVDDLGERAVNQPAAVFQSFTIPARLAHFGGAEGELRRQAISMAINREEITDVIFEGTRTPASDFTSPVIDGWSDSLKGAEVLEYNPAKAKELWAKADAISPWTGVFQISYNADGGHQGWVDAVSNSVKNVLGIEAAGSPYPTLKEVRTMVKDRTIQTAIRTGWQADYPGLFNFLGPLYATNASSNDGDYSNQQFDRLLGEGATEADLESANLKFAQAQEILLKDLPAIPLWYSNVTGGFSDKVQGVKFGWNSQPLYYGVSK